MSTQVPKKPQQKKVKINWIEDAYGNQTCHFNEGKMMAVDSYIGTVCFRDGSWQATLKGAEKMLACKNLASAKQYVQDSVDGEPLDIWE